MTNQFVELKKRDIEEKIPEWLLQTLKFKSKRMEGE
jgi:hypothetical protein